MTEQTREGALEIYQYGNLTASPNTRNHLALSTGERKQSSQMYKWQWDIEQSRQARSIVVFTANLVTIVGGVAWRRRQRIDFRDLALRIKRFDRAWCPQN